MKSAKFLMTAAVLMIIMNAINVKIAVANDFNFELDLSKSINNNVFLESDDILKKTDSADQINEDINTQLSFIFDYEFLDQNTNDAKIIIDYYSESFEKNDLDTRFLNMSLPISYYHNNFRFRTTFSRANYELSEKSVLIYSSGKMNITHRAGDNRLSLQYSHTNKMPTDSRYSGYKGSSQDLSLHTLLPRAGHSFIFSITMFNNNYKDKFISSNGYYAQSSFSKRLVGHDWSFSGKYKKTQYNQDPLFDEIRNDNQFSIDYTHNANVYKQLNFYFASEFILNQSNIKNTNDNYNYNQWINTIGIRIWL